MGIWGPIKQRREHSFEVFGRFSYTSGDADDASDNQLGVITLGGSWYYRNIRGSLNLLYSEVNNDLNNEDSGLGAGARIQYIF